MEGKICNKCNVFKSLDEYYRNKNEKDGRQYTCKSCFAEYQREYHKKNKESLRQKRMKYRSDPEIRKSHYKVCTEYQKRRRREDPLFKVKNNLRRRINDAYTASYWTKTSRNQDVLGCDYDTAFKHIESQFREGMSWDNYGEWHIDHIIPLCSANNVFELEILCHYTNLQPLWAAENISKGGSLPL
jgi:hypothetical protein